MAGRFDVEIFMSENFWLNFFFQKSVLSDNEFHLVFNVTRLTNVSENLRYAF